MLVFFRFFFFMYAVKGFYMVFICKSLWIKASAKLLKCKKYATIVLFKLEKIAEIMRHP